MVIDWGDEGFRGSKGMENESAGKWLNGTSSMVGLGNCFEVLKVFKDKCTEVSPDNRVRRERTGKNGNKAFFFFQKEVLGKKV